MSLPRSADPDDAGDLYSREPRLLWQRVCSHCGREFRRVAPALRPPSYCSTRCVRKDLAGRMYRASQAQRGE